MDSINLATGGFGTTTLTGGTFNEMLAAVKRCKGARYQSFNRSWVVTREQAADLVAQFAAGRERQAQARQAEATRREQERVAQARARRDAATRTPATDRQIQYLVALGVAVEPGMTKSRASELIDAAKGGDGVEYLGGQYAEGMQSIGEVY